MKTTFLTFTLILMASVAFCGNYVYHWKVNGINHWSNNDKDIQFATDAIEEIPYDENAYEKWHARNLEWQHQWNIEDRNKIDIMQIKADVEKEKIRANAKIAAAKLRMLPKLLKTDKTFATTFGFSAGLVRSPNFGELRLIRKNELIQKRTPLVITKIRLNNKSNSRVTNKGKLKIKIKK